MTAGCHSRRTAVAGIPPSSRWHTSVNERLHHAHPGAGMLTVAAPSGIGGTAAAVTDGGGRADMRRASIRLTCSGTWLLRWPSDAPLSRVICIRLCRSPTVDRRPDLPMSGCREYGLGSAMIRFERCSQVLSYLPSTGGAVGRLLLGCKVLDQRIGVRCFSSSHSARPDIF